jgi:uncharacterized YccA/Bax inhibitor family protein
MALFESGNPALSEKRFRASNNPQAMASGEVMTVKGTLNKFGLLFLLMMSTAVYSWKAFAVNDNSNMLPLIIGGAIGGLLVAIVISFKPVWSSFLAPVYALCEGLFLGAISAFYSNAFSGVAPNLIGTAVGLTFGVAIAIYALYRSGIIRVTETLRSVVFSAVTGIAIFYLIAMVLRMTGWADLGFLHEGTPLGIGFSLVVVAIAALKLLLDFDFVHQAAEQGAPKYMEWYGAFGLMVTIVWLYLEILRLLSKLNSRD